MKEFDESQNLEPEEKIYNIEVQLLGLPISNNGKVTVVAIIILFILLQIKLTGTFWSEGILAFLAIISFVGFRVWFLKKKYPSDLGCIEVTNSKIKFPSCLNKNIEEIVAEKNDIKEIVVFAMPKKGGGEHLTHVRFALKNQNHVDLNFLSIDMEILLRYLDKAGYPYVKFESENYKKLKYWFWIMFVILIVVVPLYIRSLLN